MLDFSKWLQNGSAILVCTDVNRRYISGFASSAGYLFVCQNGSYLLIDGRYFEAAKSCVNSGVEVILLERLSKQANEIIKANNISTMFCETDITVEQFNSLSGLFNCSLKADQDLSDYILKARSVKTEEEISNIIKAQEIAEAAFIEVLNFIKPGVTEQQIALRLDYEMRLRGSEGIAFDTIAVSGKNSALPHGVPSAKKIEPGDFVTMDFGAVCNGYRSDMTRTVAVGHADEYMQEIYNLVLTAQLRAIDAIKTGAICSIVDDAARRIITMAGYAGNFNHSTGHGVGLDIHEYPALSARTPAKLIKNQVVTVEPGIYLPEKFGVRIEDMIVVKDNSRQNLTKADKTLIIL